MRAPGQFSGTERFEVQRCIGAGGMGVVYQAYDHERDTKVALKTLRRVSPASIYRLKKEFRALADVLHPNLIRLGELVSVDDRWFFTMELIEGCDILQHVWNGPHHPRTTPTSSAGDAAPTSDDDSAPWVRLRLALRQLAQGVSALHNAGKLHRDIKPSNVLVTGDARVVLLDFGLASEVRGGYQETLEEGLLGTPAYMSPEQAAGKRISPPSDWYSVGALLYEALTGRLPFTGNVVEIISAKTDRDPPRPSTVIDDIPADLESLCADLLCRVAAKRPSASQILRRLDCDTDGSSTPISVSYAPRLSTDFVGRDSQLEAMSEAFERSRTDGPVTLFLQGSSGQGKTALAYRFLDTIREGVPAVILSGRCYERELVPYKALDSLVDALARFLRRLPRAQARSLVPPDIGAVTKLFPALLRVEAIANEVRPGFGTSDPQDLKWRATLALKELLRAIAHSTPLIVCIDDLQWGDLDSAALLRELCCPPDAPQMLLIAAYRTEDAQASDLLAELLTDPVFTGSRTTNISVPPLSRSESHALALSLLGSTAPADVRRAELVAQEAEGSPFFLGELVRYLQDSPDSDTSSAPHTVTLGDVLQRRFAHLPSEARELLEVIAVVGQPVEQALVLSAAGQTAHGQVALAVLRNAKLVRTRSGQQRAIVEPYHDRIREAVVSVMPPARLQSIHRTLAKLLENQRGSDPELLARHYVAAGESQRAFEYAEAAAAATADKLAFERAATLYRLAIEFAPPQHLGRLNLALANTLSLAGHGAEAADLYERASASTDASRSDAITWTQRAADNLLRCGHVARGLEVLDRLAGQIGIRVAGSHKRAMWSLRWQRVRIGLRGHKYKSRSTDQVSQRDLSRLDTLYAASTSLGMIDHIRGADLQSRHLLYALQYGDELRVNRALAIEAVFLAAAGGRAQHKAEALARQVELQARRLGDPYLTAVSQLAVGAGAFFGAKPRQAASAFGEAEHLFTRECVGARWESLTARYFTCMCALHRGDIPLIRTSFSQYLREAQRRKDRYASSLFNSQLNTWLLLCDDAPELALESCMDATADWPTDSFYMAHYFQLASRITALLYSKDPTTAAGDLDKLGRGMARSMLDHIPMSRLEYLILSSATAVQSGDERTLRRSVRDMKKLGFLASEGVAAGFLAALAVRQKAPAAAQEQLWRAIQLSEQAEFWLYAASYKFRLGELTGGTEGERLRQDAASAMTERGIANPTGIVDLLAPAF